MDGIQLTDHRNLENPDRNCAVDITDFPIPKGAISSQAAEILAIEQDIIAGNIQYSIDHDYNIPPALRPQFLVFSSTVNEGANILSKTGDKVEHAIEYLTAASDLSIVDRLRTFWKYV